MGDSIALAELLELGDGRYVAIVLVVQQQQTAVAFVNTLLVPVRVPFTDAVNELFAMPQQFVQQELFDLMDAADLMTLLRSASSLAVDGTIDRAAVGIKVAAVLVEVRHFLSLSLIKRSLSDLFHLEGALRNSAG